MANKKFRIVGVKRVAKIPAVARDGEGLVITGYQDTDDNPTAWEIRAVDGAVFQRLPTYADALACARHFYLEIVD